MKTKIITLESHDDLISVRDKLSWAKTPRILLVAPKYAKVNLRILDLKVLQRHADSLGAQLGLVTRRMKVRRDAESLGIPVFKSTTDAQRKEWKQPAPREHAEPNPPRLDLRQLRAAAQPKEAAWRTSLPGRIIAFTFGVAAVLAVAILFVPRARVVIYPEIKTQQALIPVSASADNERVSITGAIPARELFVTAETEQTLALTQTIIVPKSKARGIARFTNLSQGETLIPKGTIVATADEPPVRFVTLNDALFGKENNFLDVKIEALDAGSSGNVEAEKINTVEGLLGFSLTVKNPDATEGGSDTRETGATDEDRARLREFALENLRRDAETKLRAQIEPNDVLILDTLEVAEIIEESFSPEAGQPGKTLTLNMRVEYAARYVSADDLRQLALAGLDASVPRDFKVIGEVNFKIMGEPATDAEGVTRFDIDAARGLVRVMDRMQIAALARGTDPAAAKEALENKLSLRQPPEINVTPAWWQWMPLIPFNIAVEVK